jgi:hypothetical protein
VNTLIWQRRRSWASKCVLVPLASQASPVANHGGCSTALSTNVCVGRPSPLCWRSAHGSRPVVGLVQGRCKLCSSRRTLPVAEIAGFGQATISAIEQGFPRAAPKGLPPHSNATKAQCGERQYLLSARHRAPFLLSLPRSRQKSKYMKGRCSVPRVLLCRQGNRRSLAQPPNPSIEGTASGLRPPAAPHVKR